MKKYFIFSIDDGTVFDKNVIELFNEYGIKGTFNLNSNLQNYSWWSGSFEVRRHDLLSNYHLYDGHEVASHSLTHPTLLECPKEEIIRQVEGDLRYLRWIFKDESISGFAVPFSDYNEEVIDIIKNNTSATNIVLPTCDESFSFPSDVYHIKPTTITLERASYLLDKFIKCRKKEALFIYCGHSYDFFLDGTFDLFKEFVKKLANTKNIEVITMHGLEKLMKDRKSK